MKKGVYIALMVLLVAAFCGSSLYLASYFWEGKKEAERYNELAAKVEAARQETAATMPAETQQETPETEATEAETEPTEPGPLEMLPGYKDVYAENKDTVGWIHLEGSPISYPVMQTKPDNRDYYLYRDFDREDSKRGSIYIREECDVFTPSDNVTIYGHNMKDGSMFAYLGEYYEKDFWRENSLIAFDTLYEYHMYKIFSVFKTSANDGEGFAYHLMENAANQKEFNDFIAECKRLSFYDTGVTPVYGDKIICLSTCEYTLDNGRFVVAAVRIT